MKKNFTKIIMATAACIALTAGTTMAQNGRFSVGAELGLPMGDFGDANGIGFGGTLRYEHPIGDKMGLGLGAGYLTFGAKDITISFGFGIPDTTVKGNSFGAIPIQAFFKYYFSEQQEGFYAMANVGVVMGKSSGEGAESSTSLGWAPEIGYHLANLDFGLRYQAFSQSVDYVSGYDANFNPIYDSKSFTYSWIGARIAYVFGEK